MNERIRSEAESTKYESVSYRAVRPRKRDFWKVLTGRYVPEVVREVSLTVEGMNRALKEVWTGETMERRLYKDSPLFELVDRDKTGTIAIRKKKDEPGVA
jgi:hypothetical protein